MNNNSVSTRTYPGGEPNHFQLVKIAELADMRKRPEVPVSVMFWKTEDSRLHILWGSRV